VRGTNFKDSILHRWSRLVLLFLVAREVDNRATVESKAKCPCPSLSINITHTIKHRFNIVNLIMFL